jgi:type VI secretion system protein ImpG
MRDELLEYYQTELGYLRTMGAAFAKQYPKIADRLLLDPKQSTDPHVERLLQGFAFLAARVQLKIDDDFPEISEALLNVVYPHYLRPVPAMTVVQFDLDPEKGKLPTGYRISAGRELLSRLEVKGEDTLSTRCSFRTSYDTVVWPLRVRKAEWLTPGKLDLPARPTGAVAALRLRLQCFPDASFSTMQLDSLRLYLDGPDQLPYTLYELLTNSCSSIILRDPARPTAPMIELPPSALRPVGFNESEGVLPYVRRSFLGYRLLQEYFTFPQKFLFLDLSRLEGLRAAKFGTDADIYFLLQPFERPKRVERFEADITANTFRLGCTPAINLFEQTTEPVKLDQRSSEYHLIADDYQLRTTHIFSVDSVALHSQTETIAVEPMYSIARGSRGPAKAYWVARRKPSVSRRDVGASSENRRDGQEASPEDYRGTTEVWLSFIDLTGRTVLPGADSFDARITCFNGDLPNRLPIGTSGATTGDFDMHGGGPFQRITALTSPSPAMQPPLGKSHLWRLVSLLSLNYVSLTEGGLDALKTMLSLHNTNDSPAWSGRQHIDGLMEIRTRPHYARVAGPEGTAFARGRRIELEFDEEKFEGAGVFLFASVLEHFFGLYASINSFSVLAARTRQRREVLREWPPRAGWKSPI